MELLTKGFNERETQGFPIVNYTPSGKFGIRILRPWELTKLIDAIPKEYCKTQFEFLLFLNFMEEGNEPI